MSAPLVRAVVRGQRPTRSTLAPARAGAEYGAPLEVAARFAFAVVRDLAGKANENQLPMLLDY